LGFRQLANHKMILAVKIVHFPMYDLRAHPALRHWLRHSRTLGIGSVILAATSTRRNLFTTEALSEVCCPGSQDRYPLAPVPDTYLDPFSRNLRLYQGTSLHHTRLMVVVDTLSQRFAALCRNHGHEVTELPLAQASAVYVQLPQRALTYLRKAGFYARLAK